MDNREKEPDSINTAHQIQNVNAYLHTLEDNIRRMMDTMSPEERMMMRDKLHDLEQIL